MLWTPSTNVRTITNGGIVGAASPWTGVASNATTLLDGAVTELISAANNNQDSWGLEVVIAATGLAATASQAALDLLIGGATDDVLVSALLCGNATASASGCTRYYFPLHIPAGLRIAAVLASVRTSITARVGIWLYGGGVPPHRVGRKITTYGTQIDNARGQAVTPTASGGAASVTQMTASSTYDHFYMLPGFQISTDTTITPAGWINVGIGAGAATEQRLGTWWYGKDTNENANCWLPSAAWEGFRCAAPAASRLTLLVSNSGANDAAHDGLIYAVS